MLLAALLVAHVALVQDTVRVAANGNAVWPALPKPLVLIGDTDGPPETSFGSIDALAATTTGEFVSYDGSDTQLRYYDAQGRFVRNVGRSGSGPGEYRMVSGLGIVGDSVIVVLDPQNSRLAMFTIAGAPLRTVQMQGLIFGGERPLMVQRNGRILVLVGRAPKTPGGNEFARVLLDMRLTGEVVDSFALPEEDRPKGHFVLMAPDGPRWSFPDETYHARTPGGAWVHARSTQMSFVYSGTGPARLVSRKATALPLEGDERKQWEAWGTFMSTVGPKSAPHPLPSRKPFIRGIQADPSDHVWLEVYAASTKREPRPRPAGDLRPQFMLRDASTYDVFSATGSYLGRVALPEESQLLAIMPNRLYVQQPGTAGQQQIAIYPLPSVTNNR